MKNWGPVAGIMFASVLAYVVGVRLSESAMAVVVGVVFGVAASVPTSLILALILRRADSGRESARTSEVQQPTIIVAPPAGYYPQTQSWAGTPSGHMYLPPLYDEPEAQGRSPRRFRVVGED